MDLSRAVWRKSSHSTGNQQQCVEVAGNLPTVAVRDTKDRTGGTHAIGHPAWHTFVTAIKHDRLTGH